MTAPDITLYGIGVSAFVAKVRIALDLKGLAHRELAPPGGYGSAAYRAIVPAGSIPGIVIDGEAAHESNAILEWLEEIAPLPALLPAAPADRARARALLGFHDQRVEVAARAFFALVKQGAAADPAAVEAAATGMEAALARLSDLVSPAPFAFGADPGLADIAYPCTVQMARMMASALGRPLVIPPAIEGWCARVSAIPAVARSLALHRTAMADWIGSFRAG
jgi:glutathione S-transferase